jgi:hypothetical protein
VCGASGRDKSGGCGISQHALLLIGQERGFDEVSKAPAQSNIGKCKMSARCGQDARCNTSAACLKTSGKSHIKTNAAMSMRVSLKTACAKAQGWRMVQGFGGMVHAGGRDCA